jgi:uncharacterized protein YkwD
LQANELSAAVDFEAALQEAELQAEDLRVAGYRAKRWVQAVALSSRDADGIITRWAELQPTAFEDFLDPELEEVGIGIGWAEGAPLYGLVAALSYESYFEVVLEGLEDVAELRRRVVEGVNRERHLAGLPPLRLQYQLNEAAQTYAEEMRDQGFYGHVAPDGATVLERVKAAGYRLKRAGENLANGPETPEQVVDGWMGSPDHRANILNRRFTEIGVGVAIRRAKHGDYEILWVQCFGQPRR